MGLSEATATPATVTIGDKQYTAHPLSFADFGAMEERLKASVLRTAALAEVGLTQAAKDALWERAWAKVAEISFRSPEMFRYMASFIGCCAVIALSTRGEIGEAEVCRVFLKNLDQLEPALDTVLRISGLKGKPEGGAATGEGQAGG